MPRERSDVVAGGEPSVSNAERLLIAGDAAGAAALAKEVLISGRRAGIPDAEEQIALSVAIQSMAQIGRFRDVEELIMQTAAGGLQRLPTASLLLWAAVGCEVGEAEHVGQILRNQLKFCSTGLSPTDYLATCRMYVIEVLAKSSGAMEAARSWVSDSRTTLSPEAHQELLSDLDAIEAKQQRSVRAPAQEPPMMPPTPPPSVPEIQPAAPLATDSTSAGMRSGYQSQAVSRPQEDRVQRSGPASAPPNGSRNVRDAAAREAPDGPGEESRGFFGGLAHFVEEMTPEQAVAAGIAGAAVAYALYQERKHIRRALRRLMAGEGMMLLGGGSSAAARR